MTHSRLTHGISRRSRHFNAAALAGVVMLSAACGTTDAPDPLSPAGAQGRFRFVNVITDTTRGRVNAILELVPFGVNLTYAQSTPAALPSPATATYSPILTGSRTLVLKRTIDTNTVISTFVLTITEGQDRTLYAVGGTGGSPITSFVTTDDNALAALSTQAKVRVVHLSPTAGAVDLFVTATGADLAAATPALSAVTHQSASSYMLFTAGTYQIRAVPAGTAAASRAANVIITASLALTGGTVRTIVTADNNVGGTPLRAFVLSDR